MESSLNNRESILARFWPCLVIGAGWLWLFGPMMLGETVCGFRDSANLYYPLFKWIDAQWAAGEFPLWNPYCNLGMPVVGDGTSSVFYPGKLIFFCWFLSFPARYGIYLGIHVPIAAAGTYWFARTLHANRAGATLAAISFAFGGSVLFQTCNVIYLVSAAWLPFAMCSVWKMVKSGQYRWSFASAVCCSLMILGGDPQMIYHVGLLTVAAIGAEYVRKQKRRLKTRSTIKRSPLPWLAFRAVPMLVVMVVATSLLSAIQLLPTYTWSKLSERTNPEIAANLYGAFFNERGYVEIEDYRALVQEPALTIEHSYQFSQPPWSLSELFWPNISGKPFPINQRWSSGLPGADRVWVPSLYMGLLPIVLAVCGLRFWGRSRKRVWLTWAMMFFLIASFGWYGPVWLANEFIPVAEQNSEIGSQVGGLYWLMNMLLPKYFAFRYPAKLFVVSSLGISLLAGLGLKPVRMRSAWWIAIALSALSGMGLFLFQQFGTEQLPIAVSDAWFGPFDLDGAVAGIELSLLQTCFGSAIVALIGFAIRFLMLRKRRTTFSVSALLVALVCLSGAEILYSNAWLTTPVSSDVFEEDNPVREELAKLKAVSKSSAPIRIYRSPNEFFEPEIWRNESSEDRLEEVVRWQRRSLYPKHHLGENVVLLGSFSSVWPRCYQRYLDYFEFIAAWETRRSYVSIENNHRFYPYSFELGKENQLVIAPFKPLPSHDLTGTVEVFDESMELQQNYGWFSNPASNKLTTLFKNYGDEKQTEVIEFACSRFTVRVKTKAPGSLKFATAPVSGWYANIRELGASEWSQANVELTESSPGALTGLLLPIEGPGEYEVEFNYSPKELWVGMWISVSSWLVLIVNAIAFLRKR